MEQQTIPIIYQDHHLLIVNKPAGVVTHPTYKHTDGTMWDLLLAWLAQQESDGWRPPDLPDEPGWERAPEDVRQMLRRAPRAQHLAHILRRSLPTGLIRQIRRSPAIALLLRQPGKQEIPHRPIRVLIGRMRDDSRRLVHNQQVMILIDDRYGLLLHATQYRARAHKSQGTNPDHRSSLPNWRAERGTNPDSCTYTPLFRA